MGSIGERDVKWDGGAGLVSVNCPDCKGTGRDKDDNRCSKCNGSGSVKEKR